MKFKMLGISAVLLGLAVSSPVKAGERADSQVSAGQEAKLSCSSGDTMYVDAEVNAERLTIYCKKKSDGETYTKWASCNHSPSPNGNGTFRPPTTDRKKNLAQALCVGSQQ